MGASSDAMLLWLRRRMDALRIRAREPRLRAEVGWVLGSKLSEFTLAFVLLKVLTNALGKSGFGEYNLAETALTLLASLFLSPLHESYLRDYHGALGRGEGRSSGLLLLRWYGAATASCFLLGAALTKEFASWFEIGPWTTLSAGLVFLFERWRILGQEVLNIRRERRTWAVQNVTYLLLQITAIGSVMHFVRATPSAALLAYAGASAVFGLLEGSLLARDIFRLPAGPPTRLLSMVGPFGVPFAALLVLQWTQGFTDRYLLKAFIDTETVGLYVACYQVCGIPYTLLLRVSHSLLTPVAYARGHDLTDARGLWAADKVLLGGLAVQAAIGLAMVGFYAIAGRKLVVLLTSQQFLVPTGTIIALTAGRFVQSIAQALQPIFAVHHRMGSMLWFRLAGAGFTIVICSYGIHRYGVFGAAAGSLVAFALYLVCLIWAPNGCWWLIRNTRQRAAQE